MKLLLLAHEVAASDFESALRELTGGRTGLKVALIQTAGDPIAWVQDKDDSKKSTARLIKQNRMEDSEAYKNYIEKGYEVVNADLKQDPEILKETLQNVDIIEVGGGDVNYLLDWAKKSGLDTYLKDILNRGVIYIGTSAGSMLPQPDIGFTWWKEGEDVDHVGLGIVDFTTTGGPKKGEDEAEGMKRLIERKEYLHSKINFPWKTYLLKDGQMIKVDGDKIEHIGPGIKKSI